MGGIYGGGGAGSPIPTDVPFNAGDFTSDVGTWTVDPADVFNYTWINYGGRVHTLIIQLNQTSVTGTPAELRVALPGGLLNRKFLETTGYCNNNGGANEDMKATISGPGGTFVRLSRLSAAAWTASVNLTAARVEITFVSSN